MLLPISDSTYVCPLLTKQSRSARTITLKNLKRVSKELGETMTEEASVCSNLRDLELRRDASLQELREMIERADTDGDGAITPEDGAWSA